MRRLVARFACVLIVGSLLGCAQAATGCGDASRACTRVLFIGNSYTYVNGLPTMFAALAAAGGHQIEAGTAAEGGLTLADHVASSATQAKLSGTKWDLVVLQEQSQIPSVDRLRTDQMYPAARNLIRTIRSDGAKPLFYLTWADRDGWPENGLLDYPRMQAAIDAGYLTIAGEQGVAVAPVGRAWATIVAQTPRPGLWQDDGSHPTTTSGTYLAACVSTHRSSTKRRSGSPTTRACRRSRSPPSSTSRATRSSPTRPSGACRDELRPVDALSTIAR